MSRYTLMLALAFLASALAGCANPGPELQSDALSTPVFSDPGDPYCPRGEVNDTYPGDCALYSDSDSDDFCDMSQ